MFGLYRARAGGKGMGTLQTIRQQPRALSPDDAAGLNRNPDRRLKRAQHLPDTRMIQRLATASGKFNFGTFRIKENAGDKPAFKGQIGNSFRDKFRAFGSGLFSGLAQ